MGLYTKLLVIKEALCRTRRMLVFFSDTKKEAATCLTQSETDQILKGGRNLFRPSCDRDKLPRGLSIYLKTTRSFRVPGAEKRTINELQFLLVRVSRTGLGCTLGLPVCFGLCP